MHFCTYLLIITYRAQRAIFLCSSVLCYPIWTVIKFFGVLKRPILVKPTMESNIPMDIDIWTYIWTYIWTLKRKIIDAGKIVMQMADHANVIRVNASQALFMFCQKKNVQLSKVSSIAHYLYNVFEMTYRIFIFLNKHLCAYCFSML